MNVSSPTVKQNRCKRIATRWVRKLGFGFHPGTHGASYVPLLSRAQIKSYEADMRYLFKHAVDPYEVCVEAMEQV